MNLTGLLLLLGIAGAQTAVIPQDIWVLDGPRLCTFDANSDKPPTRCTQYHQVIPHKLSGGQIWNEYRWRWKDSKFEVQYSSRVGALSISEFTIGEIAYRTLGSAKYTRARAVSYAVSNAELVIGIPGDGYRFSMKGAL